MVPGQPRTILRHLNRLLVTQSAQEQSDAHLLLRFAAQREEAAFAALLSRHGRLVWDVCRHTLGHEHDAEDAFQATFLVLARKATSIRKGESVGSFLYGVAYRIAMKARQNAAARRAREKRVAAPLERTGADAGLRELQTILAEEVNRLATKYRAPFVLCCLEGKSKREAAQELGWKEGTVSSRVAHARKVLQSRLTRRGVMLAAALTTVAVAEGIASAAVPAALLDATAKAAPAFASGQAAGLVPAPVAAMTKGALQAMFVSKLKFALFVLAAVALVVAGTGALGQHAFGTKPEAPGSAPAITAAALEQPEPAKPDKPEKPLPKPTDAGAVVRDKSSEVEEPTSWDKPITLKGHKGTVWTVAYAPDGLTVVSGSDDQTVRIWNARTGELVREMNPSKRERFVPTGVAAVAYSPDGKMLAIGLADAGFPSLYDAETGKPVGDLTSRTGAFPDYAGSAPLFFTPDGKKLIAGPRRDGHFGEQKWPNDIGHAFQMWDTPLDKVNQSFEFGGPDGYWTLAMSRDGTLLASGAVKEDAIVIWKRETGKEIRRFKNGTGGTVSALAFTPDGKAVAVGTATGTIQLHDVETGKVSRTFPESHTKRRINSLSFSRDGKLLAAGNWDLNAEVVVFDVATGKVRAELKGHDSDVESVAFAPNGRDLVSGGSDKTVRIWKAVAAASTAPPLWKVSDTFPAGKKQGDAIDRMAFSSDGKLLAVTNRGDGFELWSVDKKKQAPLAAAKASQTRIYFAGFGGDGAAWAVRAEADARGGDGKEATWWKLSLIDPVTNRTRATFKDLWADGLIGAFALSPGADILATAEGKRVVLWDTKTGEELGALPGRHAGDVVTLAFTPDGKRLASGSSYPAGGQTGEMRMWDVATRKQIFTIQEKGGFQKLVLAPDGKTLAGDVVDVDARTLGFKLWTVAGKELCYIKHGARGDRPQSFAFAPDGKTILIGWSATPDEGDAIASLVFYDAATGAEVAQLEPPGRRVTGIAFSPDGKLLATGDEQGTVKWWQPAPPDKKPE
jgi:RNA polymerase sigma factor (sigma-70 family)